jgi:hypothetical protein
LGYVCATGDGIVAGDTEAAAIVGIVGVLAVGDEVYAFPRVVVGDDGWSCTEASMFVAFAGADAAWVAGEYLLPEPFVACCVVRILAAASLLIGCFAAVRAEALGGVEVGTVGVGAEPVGFGGHGLVGFWFWAQYSHRGTLCRMCGWVVK